MEHDKVNPWERYYEHDCETCIFLGHYEQMSGPATAYGKFDLYVCPQGRFPTVIARFSSAPPDYMSGLPIAVAEMAAEKNPTYPLVVALQRALQDGYLSVVATGKLRP